MGDCFRSRIANAGDGESDKLETMWNEEVADAENDITALGLSFLTVQSVKFLICGTLANVEGEEDEALTYGHTGRDCVLLYLFGALCIPIFYLFNWPDPDIRRYSCGYPSRGP